MLGSWNATARADINSNGMNYPTLSPRDLRSLKELGEAEKKDGCGSAGHYLVCAVAAALVSTGVAFALNHYAEKLIGFRNVAAIVALGCGAGSVAANLRKAGLKKRERELTELGENNAQKLFEPLGDFRCSVRELETVLGNANALVAFHENQGGGQPYADGFIKEAEEIVRYITVGQFGQVSNLSQLRLPDDSQIQRFVNCLTLSQNLSDDRQEKRLALDECNQLIAQPGFVQKLVRYMVSDSGHNEEKKLIINSDYAIFLEEEMYNLCRAALVTLAVVSRNDEIRRKTCQYNGVEYLAPFYKIINRCAEIDKGLASRLESEMGIDIISQMRENQGYRLSNDQVAAVTQWSEQYRDPLVEQIDALSAPPPVMPAINPASAQRSL